MSNPLVQFAEKGIWKSTPKLCFNKSKYISIYSPDTLKCNQMIISISKRSMFNRKPILAGVSCLHGTRKQELLCPSTKTVIPYSFLKLQAWNLEHRLLIPCESHRNCIQGANFQYDLILVIVRGWSLNKNRYSGLVFLWIFSYHIYCVILSYIIVTFLQTSKCFLSHGISYMHLLASGLWATVSLLWAHHSGGKLEKRGLALRSFNWNAFWVTTSWSWLRECQECAKLSKAKGGYFEGSQMYIIFGFV